VLGIIFIGAQLGLATPVLIDTFLTTQATGTLAAPSTSHNAQNIGSGEVIGAYRILDLAYISGNTGFQAAFQAQGGANVLTMNTQNSVIASGLATYCGSGTCGSSPTTTFDGTIGTTTPTAFGLGGVDLTSAGTNTQVRVIGNSDHIVTVYATFYQSATSYARASFMIPADTLDHSYVLKFNNIGGDALFGFNGSFSTASFASVNAITFMIEGTNSSDTFISYFGADNVPEPATFGMIAGGLGGLLWYARKRAQVKI
jgi:hypothetical protein